MPVSALILTLNEAVNLSRCLEALSWCDDIVILDSFSVDDTVSIAEKHGARVFQRQFDDFASQRNHALDSIDFKHDWVLHLDADEVVTGALADEINRVITDEKFDAYRIAPRLMFMDKWLRFSGMYPCYQVRLGKRDVLRFKQYGHGQREDIDPEKIGTLKASYLHYNFSKGIDEWLERHRRYAAREAEEAMRQGGGSGQDWGGLVAFNNKVRQRRALKALSYHLPCRAGLRFIYMYFLRLGFLDGRAGLAYCRMLANYEGIVSLKMAELRREKYQASSH